MPSLTVEQAAPAVDWARWYAAVPALLERFRSLRFDADGVAVFADGRREGLRLVSGTLGQPGSRYRVVTEVDPVTAGTETRLDNPADVALEPADPGNIGLTVNQASVTGRIGVHTKPAPGRLTLGMDTPLPDLPSWLGDTLTVDGTVDLDPVAGPQVEAEVTLHRIGGHLVAGLVGAGPAQRVQVTLRLRASGLLALVVPLWPLVARHVRAEIAAGLAEVCAWFERELRPDRSVDDLVDQTFADAVASLAVDAPAASH